MATYTGIGLMSGTSLDGLDICCVEFTGDHACDIWSHRILKAQTVPYTAEMQSNLAKAHAMSGVALSNLNVKYGHFLGQTVKEFMEREQFDKVHFVASPGHTVYHQPENGFTLQIGDGETIASYFKKQVIVSNFRNRDVALGGQGAPLVPMGEHYLFNAYPICLNLGGIANATVYGKGFDICPCNMVLNHLAKLHNSGMEFDLNGELASAGCIKTELVQELNDLPYYSQVPPKSLGYEWVLQNVIPKLDTQKYAVEDLLRTCVEHITEQITCAIAKQLQEENQGHTYGNAPISLLITGGGALNDFLVSELKMKISNLKLNISIVESDLNTINYKEALVLAFLGLRCLLGLPNISARVTGANTDCVAGSIHLPTSPEHFPRKLGIIS